MSERRLKGYEVLNTFGINYRDGDKYKEPFTPPEPTDYQLNHPFLAHLSDEQRRKIIRELHFFANGIRGNYWDYGNIGVSASRLNEELTGRFEHLESWFHEALESKTPDTQE